MKIGDTVYHQIGRGPGLVIWIDGFLARVRFENGTRWVWITDCEAQ